ncbi:MAG: hypothetical protein ACR2HR_07625 [Euzebya sp.]
MSSLDMPEPQYIEVDERGRTSLKRFLDGSHRFYAVEPLGGGAFTLRPARLVTEDDLALTARPEIVAELRAAASAAVEELTEVNLDDL